MKSLTHTNNLFNLNSFFINQTLIATNKVTNETTLCLVSHISYTMIEATFFKEENRDDLGIEGESDRLVFQNEEIEQWELKEINKSGEIVNLKNLLLTQETFWLSPNQFLLLHYKPTDQQLTGLVSYASDEQVSIVYIVGRGYDVAPEELTITLKEADEWEGEILVESPITNYPFKKY